MANKRQGATFEEWMKQVTSIMVRKCGLGPDDVPDWCYRSSYDANDQPNDAADMAIEAARDY